MFHNYIFADVSGIVRSAAWLSLFLVPPGYVLGWLTNACFFRSRSMRMRFVLSTPISVAIMPVFIYLSGSQPRIFWLATSATWIALVALLAGHIRKLTRLAFSREVWIAVAFALCWVLLATLSLADLQLGDRLYLSTSTYDHSVRSAFTAAASREIPPANPFFADSPAHLLRYHYFWMMLCSLPCRLAAIAPRHALYGGTLWAGIALMSLIVIGLESFAGVRERLAKRALLAFGLLAVTGLDIIPNLYLSHFKAPMYADPEWWNVQVSSWAGALIWAPHHVMAMVACLLGFAVLRQPAKTYPQRGTQVIFAGVAFASACGLSFLSTFAFAFALAIWGLVSAWRRWWGEVLRICAAGVAALVCAFPFLHSVAFAGGADAGANGVLALAVREFPLGMRMLTRHTGLHFPPTITNLAFLPLSYFLEFGFFLLVAAVRLKAVRTGRIKLTREEASAWSMIAASFLIGSFLRSTSLISNDLGWRCFLQAQFVFLLWGACLIDQRADAAVTAGREIRTRRAAIAMLCLGVLGTIYQIIDFRIYSVLVDRGIVARAPDWIDPDRQVGRRTFALRSAYESISENLPRNGVVQYNPMAPVYIPHLLYSGHRASIGLPNCGSNFGGSPDACRRRTDAIVPVFTRPSNLGSTRLDRICAEFGIDVLVVTDLDPAWGDRNSWVWNREPFLANSYVRAFRFGAGAR